MLLKQHLNDGKECLVSKVLNGDGGGATDRGKNFPGLSSKVREIGMGSSLLDGRRRFESPPAQRVSRAPSGVKDWEAQQSPTHPRASNKGGQLLMALGIRSEKNLGLPLIGVICTNCELLKSPNINNYKIIDYRAVIL